MREAESVDCVSSKYEHYWFWMHSHLQHTAHQLGQQQQQEQQHTYSWDQVF